MGGFGRASAATTVQVKWVLCFLRDMSPESAMQHYERALDHGDMIVGLGLDSESYKLPPSLFEAVWARARADNVFRLTAHCDDGAREDVHEHIREAACNMDGKGGADRIDHGIDAADRPELMELIQGSRLGADPLSPCAYLGHRPAGPSVLEDGDFVPGRASS
jgi:adenosine deaminase